MLCKFSNRVKCINCLIFLFALILTDGQRDVASAFSILFYIIFKGLEFTNIMLDQEAEIKKLEAILKFRERIDSNANLDIIYTQMFVEIGEVLEWKR